MHSHDIPLHLFTTPLAQFVHEAAAIYQKWRWQRLWKTPPLVFPKTVSSVFGTFVGWKCHLYVLNIAFSYHFSFLFGWMEITSIPGCDFARIFKMFPLMFLTWRLEHINPLGCRTKPRPRGISMSWSGQDFWRFHKGTMKGQFVHASWPGAGWNVDSWKSTYDSWYITYTFYKYVCLNIYM